MLSNTPAPSPTPVRPLFLAICTPHGGNNADHLHHISYKRMIFQPLQHQGRPVVPVEFEMFGDEYARGRNALVRQMMDYELANNMRFDWVLWVDDDMVLPQHTIERLLSHNAPIVSGLYFMRKPPYLPVAYRMSTTPEHGHLYWSVLDYPRGQVMEIDAAGFGCVLTAREVYDRLPEPYFAWRAVDWHPDGSVELVEDEHSPTLSPPDDSTAENKSVGEDLYFFGQAKAHGYRVLLDAGVSCGHVGQHVYDESQFLQNQPFYHRIPAPGKLSILFLPAPSPQPWDGNAFYASPLGGSEAMVAIIAKELAQRHGHVVYVAAGGSTNEIDGVHYRPAQVGVQLATSMAWDVVVVSRWTDMTLPVAKNPNVKAVVFWSHDLMSWQERRRIYDSANCYIAISRFHANYLFNDRSFEGVGSVSERLIPNCIDLSLFSRYTPLAERIPGKLVWLSNPNRGLMSAVRIFRRLRSRWPHLTLHIYGRSSVYGWKPGDEGHEEPYLPDSDEPGVVLHDALPRPQLARELSTAWAMFYPTTWAETFSVAALESQAAGTPVIANPYAALVDVVHGGILTWDFESAVEQLMDPLEWERLSFKGREVGREWSSVPVGATWDAVLREEVALWQD